MAAKSVEDVKGLIESLEQVKGLVTTIHQVLGTDEKKDAYPFTSKLEQTIDVLNQLVEGQNIEFSKRQGKFITYDQARLRWS